MWGINLYTGAALHRISHFGHTNTTLDMPMNLRWHKHPACSSSASIRCCAVCLAGGHFDNYIASYYHYKPGKIAEAFFQRPAICPEKPPTVVESSPTSGWQHGLHAQIMSILPNRHYGARDAAQLQLW